MTEPLSRRLAAIVPGLSMGTVALGIAALLVAGASMRLPVAQADPVALPMPAGDVATGVGPQTAGLRTVVLAGGCFWGVQGVFEHVRGVTRAVAGYAGGSADTARYETVSTGATGHAESVQVTFDPARVSYAKILQIFFSVALDPTEVNRQGPDGGTQYRSEVFVTDDEEGEVARRYIASLDAAHVFARPIATRVETLRGFYPAEAHHQDYLVRNPDSGYIATFDLPKVAALQRLFPSQYSPAPVLVGPTGLAAGAS